MPIKISTAAPKHRIKDLASVQKLKKMAMSQNKNQFYTPDTRPLTSTGYNKLKTYLEPLPMKALVAIVAGETPPKGIKFCHTVPIIQFLLTELEWREGQPSVVELPKIPLLPSPLDDDDDKMETSMRPSSQDEFLSSQSDPSKGLS